MFYFTTMLQLSQDNQRGKGQAMEYDYSQYGDYRISDQGLQVSEAAAGAALMGMVVFILIGAIIGYVINAFLLGRIFKKAGVEQWKAWVPIYNTWITFELGGQKGWMALLLLVPVVNIVAVIFYFIAAYYIGLKFGKEGVFVLLAIFLPIVWLAWLAFDKSTWKGAAPAAATANANEASASSSVPPTAPTNEPKPPTTPPTTS